MYKFEINSPSPELTCLAVGYAFRMDRFCNEVYMLDATHLANALV